MDVLLNLTSGRLGSANGIEPESCHGSSPIES